MSQSLSKRLFMLLLLITFSVFPLLTTAAESDGKEADVISITNLNALIDQLAVEGEFASSGSIRALTMHLTALEHFELQKEKDKVLEHMKGFKTLLSHQLEQELMSKEAYNTIMDYTEMLLEEWNSLAIVRDGEANALVIVAHNADEQTSKAAATLVEYVHKSTGASLPIMTEEEFVTSEEYYLGHIPIYVGQQAPGEEAYLNSSLENMDEHGFMIYPNEHSITIMGPSVWGTLNGVYDFVERFLGVRWLIPGPNGEDVPTITDLSVPKEEVKEEPVFAYRVLSPAHGIPEDPSNKQLLDEWAQRNKLQGLYNRPIEHNENMSSLFPPEKFGETHPEFYKDGRPPAPGVRTGWQPCYSIEGTIDAAVAELIEYFDENPHRQTYSLGVNDSGGYCEGDPSHPEYPNEMNSIGVVNMSEIYYNWVNKVVEKVSLVYPDKWYGVLAYQNVMDPPSFSLHPRIVPFITKDRMAWIDEDIQAEGHQQMEEWNEAASQMGFYEYMYGVHYVLPRIFSHTMADNFQYAGENQVFGFYTEMYPNLGDGPKAWLAAKLQWNPDQDVDELLQEWYERMVGPEAATHLADYYDLWESFWLERVKESAWFERGKGNTYLSITDASYVNLVTDEDIAESQSLLTSVLEKARTPQQQTRAQLLQRAFQYYEATVLSYPRKSDPPEDETAALAMFESVANGTQFAQLRHDIIEQYNDEPSLKFHSKPRMDWSGWNPYEFWHLVDYLAGKEPNGGPLSNRIAETIDEDGPSEQRQLARLLEGLGGNLLATTNDNASFERGDSGDVLPWRKWNESGKGTMNKIEGFARTGNASLLIDQLERGGPTQIFAVMPGLTALQTYYFTPPGTEEGTIELMIHLRNEQGQRLSTFRTSVTELTTTAGEWASIGLLEEIPAVVNGEEVTHVQVVIALGETENTQVYIDDAVAYQLGEELSPQEQLFWERFNDIRNGDLVGSPLHDELIELAENEEPSEEREQARLLLNIIEGGQSIALNSSFESGGDTAPPWRKWIAQGGTIDRIEGFARTGNASLLIQQLERGGPTQTFRVEPGIVAAQVYFYAPAETENGTIAIGLHLEDADGKRIASFSKPDIPLSSSGGEWSSIEILENIPDIVNGEEVTRAQLVIALTEAHDTQVYIDDAAVFQQ